MDLLRCLSRRLCKSDQDVCEDSGWGQFVSLDGEEEMDCHPEPLKKGGMWELDEGPDPDEWE